ncbi:hypothetical protein A3C26_03525 [Candidatus Daviesbacteria bacterium RIFCSPHIGHO2_02_FULL_39_12]|uniref:SprT-like domain-containing protein n=2 Tax=Candidatus Daviesiibacteriota TaxID=1752718 RepID=A0A1F5JAP6_9BACT|nr:MAG: hypothetical protein A3C26_03525 [Candidatus Daviesbacteria bacterium RIFCSPHIGHO2_02_FULL_39_12]OGE72813.1 MAG: hypothetical protein A3H40_01975 [Candidatus Daviesbacteria bacterium RIFCSPLOWO2_02_FULL_38_15]
MPAQLRDNNWLLSRLDDLWSHYFADVSQDNPVLIGFGRYSKYRLGSIKMERRGHRSKITITGMFKNPNIPTAVVDHTIAHELVHYTHGFSSKKVRLHRYPHAGGIVNKELEQRGMGFLTKAYKSWIKKYVSKSIGAN